MTDERPLFDDATWAQLPEFFDQLPRPVRLNVWGDTQASESERQAVRLVEALSERFPMISYRSLPRRINHPYYPVTGIMGLHEAQDEELDYGLRIIGLPIGMQVTSLIAAIQSVAFQGMTSEAGTRIQLHRLRRDLRLELITSAEDEAGTVMAHRVFNMAIASQHVRAFLIMGDLFPDAILRYSVSHVPHLVIDGRIHVEGVVSEDEILRQMAKAIQTQSN